MKKLFAIATLIAGTLVMVSCGDDDSTTIIEEVEVIEGGLGVLVTSNITSDVTWSADSIYVLDDRIAVESGATLTIEAGTIIKGNAGTGANATALIIAQGATLNAAGTASAPIIFTSRADEITVSDVAAGNFASPNLSDDVDGLWGGLIVLGNAPIFVSGDAATANIEGIPPSDDNGIYGGSTAADNSGTITYVSVRHGGSNIGEGNEINGITFGGVGSGTTVNHIEVIANQDDGVEFFGGTVNVSHVLVWNNGDDAVDTDQGYAGTIDNGIIINPGDKAFELDGGEGSDDTQTSVHTISNFSVELGGSAGAIDVDDDTNVTLSGIYFYGMTEDTGDSYDMTDGKTGITNTFTNIEIIDTWTDDDDEPVTTAPGDFLDAAKSTIVSSPTNAGANEAQFTGWTVADARGAF
ncbi:MAG: hypothetical protein RLN88_15665 [Ekhidna sp.]|uniref:hypothetical protein n=1 Tax=Ekhidna sp. TaxID=2608089 RepID=UPI0032EFC188